MKQYRYKKNANTEPLSGVAVGGHEVNQEIPRIPDVETTDAEVSDTDLLDAYGLLAGAGIGAGVGGLGGYGLSSLATKNKLIRLLGTLAGAGAGGYVGGYAGSRLLQPADSAEPKAAEEAAK